MCMRTERSPDRSYITSADSFRNENSSRQNVANFQLRNVSKLINQIIDVYPVAINDTVRSGVSCLK